MYGGQGQAGTNWGYCPRCGAAQTGPTPFCPQCGAPQARASFLPTPPSIPPVVPSRRSGQLGPLAAVLLVGALVVGIVGVVLLNQHSNGTSPNFYGATDAQQPAPATSCTVGLHASGLSVTVEGNDASLQCAGMLSGKPVNGATWFLYGASDGLPTGPIVCQVTVQGDHYTVRDSGGLYGSQVCMYLEKLAAGAAPGSTAMPGGNVSCGLQVHGHDATVLADASVCSDFESSYPPADGYWDTYSSSYPPSNDSLVCSGTWEGARIEIWDSGGQFYATDLCKRLGWK
jgi:hypothetical protein